MSTILYLGPEGTHSHEAALQHGDSRAKLVPCLSHYDVFERLCAPITRDRPVAIVPVENSSEGPVTQTLDQLAAYPTVTVTNSFSIAVRHHLLVGPATRRLSAIQRVYSHPQALGQCRASLRALLPHAELMPDSSTAAAARINGLAILKRNLQDNKKNSTRFFVITASRHPPRTCNKPCEFRSLIHLVIGNRPGALLHALSPFDAAGVNLTFIQSRPLPGRPWEYGFFIEAVTDWKSAAAEAAWRLVVALSETGRQIGTYPVT